MEVSLLLPCKEAGQAGLPYARISKQYHAVEGLPGAFRVAGFRGPTIGGRSEFKRCWKGQGACRTYCTRHETYMHMCPDASLCCVAYGIRPLPSKTEPV
uniref:Beta-defensin n=1 Tax=Felis catus TaxID=9685 RepID=A0ABI8A2I3_FELCA